jgi:hypothetical protein
MRYCLLSCWSPAVVHWRLAFGRARGVAGGGDIEVGRHLRINVPSEGRLFDRGCVGWKTGIVFVE